ncbi:MAG TPA: hypothetical protein IGS40_25475 [Trichormus sp. M33_DOE_039]|nr:hypothetical protein [Trichormus sp. M33_DOE_039]
MDLQSHQNLEQRVGIIDVLDADRQSNTWHNITFDVPFAEDKKVVIVPMVQTYNGFETPGLRIQNVSRLGFDIRIDEVIGTNNNLSDGYHVPEVVGWIAYGFVPVTADQLPQLDYQPKLAEATYTRAQEASYTPATVEPATQEASYTPASVEPATQEASYTPATVEPATQEASYTPASVEPARQEAIYAPATVEPATQEASYTPASVEPATQGDVYTPAQEASYTSASGEATYNNSMSGEATATPVQEATYTPAFGDGELTYTRTPEEIAYIPAPGELAYTSTPKEATYTSGQDGYYTANIWQTDGESTYTVSVW